MRILRNRTLLYGLTLLLSTVLSCSEADRDNKRPNVLFIAIDDMNDWTTVFNPKNPIKTPNIDKLAQSGAFFSHAYCSSPACNPSRASVMTGTRPHNTGIYGNQSDWKVALPGIKTLQRLFKENGYYVCGAGKIFHHQNDWAFHDNGSFHEYLMMSINEPYPDKKLNGFEWFGTRNTDWGAWPEDITKTADYRTAEYAIHVIQQKHKQPFFLNVGIYKPHSPFFAPREYFDIYPMGRLEMPELKDDDCIDLPSGARALVERTNKGYGSGKGFWNGLLKAKDLNENVYEEFVQAYQACASFADDMVGKVLDALEKSPYSDNTIIILWSDHGFHLGEKEHIEKFALWEKTTHVPFVIVVPGQVKPGTLIDQPVDLSCIYPTLTELCGLETPAVDGKSVVPLLQDKNAVFPPALMTYMKGNHAIRTNRWRYIHYADSTEELYDHEHDPHEWTNLSGNNAYDSVIMQLKKYIPVANAEPVADLSN